VDRKTANELDRLLAGDGTSGPEADAIFERVMAEVERAEPRHRRRHALWAGGAIAAAAAIGVLALRPAATPSRSELTARGAAQAAPRIELVCSGGSLDACPISAKLVFAVTGDDTSGFVSAYAEPLDPGAERVWYFSRQVGSPQLNGIGDGTRVLDRAVQLASAHQPGGYRVHVFLSEAALTPDEMLGGAGASATANLQVELHIVGD
jgi:hypothetical protein